MHIYQAGPLFTAAEVRWHEDFKRRLTAEGHLVWWPGDFFTQQEIEDWSVDAPKNIMKKDSETIEACDVVVALLDGAQVDDGTAWEIGYAYAKGVPVIGIRTDFRNGGDTAHGCVNAMIEGSCVSIEEDEDGVVQALRKLKADAVH